MAPGSRPTRAARPLDCRSMGPTRRFAPLETLPEMCLMLLLLLWLSLSLPLWLLRPIELDSMCTRMQSILCVQVAVVQYESAHLRALSYVVGPRDKGAQLGTRTHFWQASQSTATPHHHLVSLACPAAINHAMSNSTLASTAVQLSGPALVPIGQVVNRANDHSDNERLPQWCSSWKAAG